MVAVTGATSGIGRALAGVVELAQAVAFLLGPTSSYATGTALSVDGGVMTGV